MDKKSKGGKKKQKTVPEVGVAHIRATFNNTLITISDMSGNVVSCLLYTSPSPRD